MRVAVSILWLVFTLLFLDLGRQHKYEANRDIPQFPAPKREALEKVGQIQVMNQDLDQPVKDFATKILTRAL